LSRLIDVRVESSSPTLTPIHHTVTVSRPRAETAPLFGETKGETKLFTWVVLGLLAVAALEAITVALVYAVMDKNFDHLSLVLTVLVAAIVATVLYRWHTNGGECVVWRGVV
jgi:hypothetical protein